MKRKYINDLLETLLEVEAGTYPRSIDKVLYEIECIREQDKYSKKKKISKSDKIKIKYMNNIAKTRYELGAGVCPGGAKKLLYEGRIYSRAEMNTL